MVHTGLSILVEDALGYGSIPAVPRGARVGLVCHGASVDQHLRYTFDLLAAAGYDLLFILAPEHGLFGDVPYMQRVEHSRLSHLGVPVVSLYGDSIEQLRPPPGLLDGIDCLVCDIQDVGSRYYTYIATMAILMEVCSGTGIRFVVLDRPNPIGLDLVEGNIIPPTMRSFVGYMQLPARHALTPGEAALHYRNVTGLDLDLQVVACRGLSRTMTWHDMDLPWIPPSPNIPTPETALVYTGMCLLEGTNLSEGRGTASPFFLAGAPFITDPWGLVAELNRAMLPGVAFRPVRFTPAFDKWASKSCGGVHIVVTDEYEFKSLLTGMVLISTIARLYAGQFSIRTHAYEFVSDTPALDLLIGDRTTGKALVMGVDAMDLYNDLQDRNHAWWDLVQDVLLYR